MNEAAAVAFVQTQTACMLVELEAMRVANAERAHRGMAYAYGEDAFMALIDKYGCGHNAALMTMSSR